MPEKRKLDGENQGDEGPEAKRLCEEKAKPLGHQSTREPLAPSSPASVVQSGRAENHSMVVKNNKTPLQTIRNNSERRPSERKAVDDASTEQYGRLKNVETEYTIPLKVWNEYFAKDDKLKWGGNFSHRVWEKLERESQIARRQLIVNIQTSTDPQHTYYLCIPKAVRPVRALPYQPTDCSNAVLEPISAILLSLRLEKEKASLGDGFGSSHVNRKPATASGKTIATTTTPTTNTTSQVAATPKTPTPKTPTAIPGPINPTAQRRALPERTPPDSSRNPLDVRFAKSEPARSRTGWSGGVDVDGEDEEL
ncbi:hypothetical protein PRZ48_011854 [Zasmidium cellare]|uniref:Uncharacterized protein n=1 Tax=Zasmidium cellare TaxID=395010 RepID=A0ABR0E7I5_ZASCE|nr:hypothetical protein PRZ48_011854 [Zasmidium cellare]